MSKSVFPELSPDRCTSERFRQLSEEYCNLLRLFGLDTKPYQDPSLRLFMARGLKDKSRAITYLEANIGLLGEYVTNKDEAWNSQKLLWRALKRMNFTPVGDIFDKIGDEDIVEVYLDDHTQVFRNLTFFRNCSYSIEELLCKEWYRLYKRDWRITLKIMRRGVGVLLGRFRNTVPWDIPFHQFEEIHSERKLRHEITFKYLSPISFQGKRIGAISTNFSSPIGENGVLWNKPD